MNYIINFFGTGIRFWVCEIPIPMYNQMNKIKQIKKVEWENLLFDFDFLNYFGFSHWSELSSNPEQTGFLLEPQNRIEIKLGAKFITRFRAKELLNNETIFPLYHTKLVQFPVSINLGYQTLILVQFEKGLIAKYKFETKMFSINDFSFNNYFIKNLYFLSNIDYSQFQLKKIADDTVVTDRLVIQC